MFLSQYTTLRHLLKWIITFNIKKIKREVRFFIQRINNGFDDSDLWDFDVTVAKFILPRLKRFKQKKDSRPSHLSINEWNNIIDCMILSFEKIVDSNYTANVKDKDIIKGLDYFRNYFHYLWY